MTSVISWEFWGALPVLVLFGILAAGWLLPPDVKIFPAKKKRDPGPMNTGVLLALFLLIGLGMAASMLFGALDALGLPVKALLLASAGLMVWAMVGCFNVYSIRVISENWIRIPLCGVVGLFNLLLVLGAPLLFLDKPQGDSANIGPAYWLDVGFLFVAHGGLTLALLYPERTLPLLLRVPLIQGFFNHHTLEQQEETPPAEGLPRPGATGTCKTPLRPVGKVLCEGVVYQARSHGPLIDAGTLVEVIAAEAGEIVVRPQSPLVPIEKS